MNLDAYMPFYGRDFYAAVEGHSEAVEMGYMRAIWHYWAHTHCEGLKDDDAFLRRLTRCPANQWKETKRVIFGEFFFERDGLWHQKRAKEEYDKIKARAEARQAGGRATAQKRWGS